MHADGDVKFVDPATGVQFQFVAVADFAPFAVRRTAFLDVGMLDEGMAPEGESGIISDYEFCERSWGAGWQVGQMATPRLKGCAPPRRCESGTAHGMSHELREKNQALNPITYDRRMRFREHKEIFEEVRRVNTRLLRPRPGVDPTALFAADEAHHYYTSYVDQVEPLAEEDRGTREVRRSEADVCRPMPKKPMTVSKNMRLRGGGMGRRQAKPGGMEGGASIAGSSDGGSGGSGGGGEGSGQGGERSAGGGGGDHASLVEGRRVEGLGPRR